MNFDFESFSRTPVGTTLAFILLIIGLRFFLIKILATSDFARMTKRKLKGYVHNLSIVIVFISIIVIWFTELQSFALSLVALAVAFAITTKEYTLNIMGGIYRTVNHPFHVGDRIEMGEYRGEVISINLSSTTLLEVGPHQISHQYTGKSITLPNSLYLSKPVINETYTRKYLLHVFKVPISLSEDVTKEEEWLLEAAKTECESISKDAEEYMAVLRERENIDMPPMVPRITIHFKDEKSIYLVVRIPAPFASRGKLEDAIIKRYLKLRRSV